VWGSGVEVEPRPALERPRTDAAMALATSGAGASELVHSVADPLILRLTPIIHLNLSPFLSFKHRCSKRTTASLCRPCWHRNPSGIPGSLPSTP
jgi:hypothetical protein